MTARLKGNLVVLGFLCVIGLFFWYEASGSSKPAPHPSQKESRSYTWGAQAHEPISDAMGHLGQVKPIQVGSADAAAVRHQFCANLYRWDDTHPGAGSMAGTIADTAFDLQKANPRPRHARDGWRWVVMKVMQTHEKETPIQYCMRPTPWNWKQ